MIWIRAKAIATIIFLFASYGASPYCFEQENPAFDDKDLTLWSGAYFPVWIALNASPRAWGVPQRTILLFIEEKNFTESNLRIVFSGLASEEPIPKALTISAFSDKRMLRRAVDRYSYPLILDFPNTPDGRKAQEQFEEKYYPLKTGYYRAFYWRSQRGEESFKYSPDPGKEEYTTVQLLPR